MLIGGIFTALKKCFSNQMMTQNEALRVCIIDKEFAKRLG